jgi:transglutaminase-like putative cysteine protease
VKYQITHKTSYSYADLVPVCHNLVHLAPRTTSRQSCSDYRLRIDPAPAFRTFRDDYFGNRTEYFSIERAHRKLEIIAESTLEVSPSIAHESRSSPPWEECVIRRAHCGESAGTHAAVEPIQRQLTFPSPRVPLIPQLCEYAAISFPPNRPVLEALVDLSARIHGDFQFDPRATTVDTPLADVLRLRRGVCQDFAHLATGCVRAMGLTARYTSGYLRTTPPPGKPRLVGADVSHAWCAAWCGLLGWIDFDPTNNRLVDDSYVTIAWGRDYGDVCPIQGVFVGGGEHHMSVSVDVAPQVEN